MADVRSKAQKIGNNGLCQMQIHPMFWVSACRRLLVQAFDPIFVNKPHLDLKTTSICFAIFSWFGTCRHMLGDSTGVLPASSSGLQNPDCPKHLTVSICTINFSWPGMISQMRRNNQCVTGS